MLVTLDEAGQMHQDRPRQHTKNKINSCELSSTR